MPTIALHLMRLPQGEGAEVPKSTTNAIYTVVSGKARIRADGGFDETLAAGDVAAVPCWHAHSLEAPDNAVVFKVSDEPIFQKLGLSKTATN
jgi:gentisate 1,2-dioxygenase